MRRRRRYESDSVVKEAARVAREAAEAVKETATKAAREVTNAVKETVVKTAEAVKEAASETAKGIVETTSQAATEVAEGTAEAGAETAKGAARDIGSTAKDTAEAAGRKESEIKESKAADIEDMRKSEKEAVDYSDRSEGETRRGAMEENLRAVPEGEDSQVEKNLGEKWDEDYCDHLARQTRREVLGDDLKEKPVSENEGLSIEKRLGEKWDEDYCDRLARETRREVLGESGDGKPVPERKGSEEERFGETKRDENYYDRLARETRREVLGESGDKEASPNLNGSEEEEKFREQESHGEEYYDRLARETRWEVLGRDRDEPHLPEKSISERGDRSPEKTKAGEVFKNLETNDDSLFEVRRCISSEDFQKAEAGTRKQVLEQYDRFLEDREKILRELRPDAFSKPDFRDQCLSDAAKLTETRKFLENAKDSNLPEREPEKYAKALNRYNELLNKRYDTLARIEPRPRPPEWAVVRRKDSKPKPEKRLRFARMYTPERTAGMREGSKPEGTFHVVGEGWVQSDEKSVVKRAVVSGEKDGVRFKQTVQTVRSESPLGDTLGFAKSTEVREEKKVKVTEDSVRRIWWELSNTKEAFVTRTNRPYAGVLEPEKVDQSRTVTVVDRGERKWLKNVDYAAKTEKWWVDEEGVMCYEQCTQAIGHRKTKKGETDVWGAAVTDRFRLGEEKDEKISGETTFIEFDPRVTVEKGEAEKRESENKSLVESNTEAGGEGQQETVLKFYRDEGGGEKPENAHVEQVIYRIVHEFPEKTATNMVENVEGTNEKAGVAENPEEHAADMVETIEEANETKSEIENNKENAVNTNDTVETTEPTDTTEERTTQSKQGVERDLTPENSSEKAENENRIDERVEGSSESSQERDSDNGELRWEDAFILVEGRERRRILPILRVLEPLVDGVRKNGGDEERYAAELRKIGAPVWLSGWMLRRMIYERRIPEDVLRAALEYLKTDAYRGLKGGEVSHKLKADTEPEASGKRKFSDEQLIQLHQQGLSKEEAAERLKAHEFTILKYAKRLGLRFKSSKTNLFDEQLIQLYKQGLIGKEIAERLGVHEVTVYRRAKKLGIKFRRNPPKFSDKQLIQLYQRGLGRVKIAEKLDVDITTVDKRAKKLGIKFRGSLKKKVELVLLKYFRHDWFTSNDVREQYNALFGENIPLYKILRIIAIIYGDGKNSILVRAGPRSNYRYRLRTEKGEEGLEDFEKVKEKLWDSREILQVLERLLKEDPEIEVSVENFETYIISGRKLLSLILRVLKKSGSWENLENLFDFTLLTEKIKSGNISLEELLKMAEYLYPLEEDKNPSIVPSILIPFHWWAGGRLNPRPVSKLYKRALIRETLHKIEHTLKAMGIKYLRTNNNTLLIQKPQNPWEAYEYRIDVTKGKWYHQPTVKTYVETEGENGLKTLLNQALRKLKQQNREPSYKQLAWELNDLGADLNKGIIQEMSETGWVSVSDLYALFAFLEKEDLDSLREHTIEELLEKGKITKKETITLPKETLRELDKILKHRLGYLKIFTMATGLDVSTIYRYLRGLSEIPIEHLEKICENLELKTIKYLKLHYRKAELELSSWFSYEKTTEIINEKTIIERITITDPKNFEEKKLTLVHTREEGGGVITIIPELNVELSPLETPWYLQSPHTFIEIDKNDPYKDEMNIIQYMLKEGTKRAGDMIRLAEILKTGLAYFHQLTSSENRMQVSMLLKLALYTDTNLKEIGKYVTQVGDIKGKKGEVYTTSLDSPDGAMFITCIVTDGSSIKRYRGKGNNALIIKFINQEEEYIEKMQDISERIFGYKPDKNERERDGVLIYSLKWGDSVGQILTRVGIIPVPHTRINIRIPEEIREGNTETKKEPIKGLIICEGHAGKSLKIGMRRDILMSWQEAKKILQQNDLNFSSPEELGEYLKQKHYKQSLHHKYKGIRIAYTKSPPVQLEKEKHAFLEDAAKMIKELETEKISEEYEETVKTKLLMLEFRPYRVTGGWELTIDAKGTRILHEILKGFLGYKELMHKNEEAVERNTEVDEKGELTPEDLQKIWSISNKIETAYKREKCYAVSFDSLPDSIKDKLKPPPKIREKQRRCAEKTVEIFVDGEKVRVRGMPSIMNCKVLLFSDKRYIIKWGLTRPKAKIVKKIWKRIKAIVKEKLARNEALEVNIEEIRDEPEES